MRLKLLLYLIFISIFKLYSFKIPFYFQNKRIMDILDEVSLKNGISFLYPSNPYDFDVLNKLVITYKPKDILVDAQEALSLSIEFLSLAGFAVYKSSNNIYTILKIKNSNEDNINRYNLPIYVNSKIDDLPNNNTFIRYILYLNKIKLDDNSKNSLTEIISKLSDSNSNISLLFSGINTILISDRVNKIKEIVSIIKDLDQRVPNSTFCIVDLNNISSYNAINIIYTLKNAVTSNVNKNLFFNEKNIFYNISENTSLVPFSDNKLIILGLENEVDSLASFIKYELDSSLENGRSILHVYNLEYLDAQTIAPIIQGILDNKQVSSNQSKSLNEGYDFHGAQVVAEINPSAIQKQQSSVKIATETIDLSELGLDLGKIGLPQEDIKIGGNRLLIACRNQDWNIIKKLIKDIDVASSQVILEALILDVRFDGKKLLQSTFRNMEGQLINKGVQFLSTNISNSLSILGNTPTGLVQDILNLIGPNSLQENLPIGSTLISFNDPKIPGIFGLVDILQSLVTIRVLAHPFLVSRTNKRTYIESTETKRVRGSLAISSKGTFEIPIEELTATVIVEMVPIISPDNKVRLDIGIVKVDFIGATLDRRTRFLKTTAILNDSQILVIAGLNEERISETKTGTPLLLNIPLVGWLFKGEDLEVINTNILLFISPKIIYPKVTSSSVVKDDAEFKLNEHLDIMDIDILPKKDPIIDNFFNESSDDLNIISNYAVSSKINVNKRRILSLRKKYIKKNIINKKLKNIFKDSNSIF